MLLMTILAVSLGFCLGFTVLALYFIITPGGLVEHLVNKRLDRGDTVKKSVESLRNSYGELRTEHASQIAVLTNEIQLMKNRITSFESKWGRQSKKEEREELQRQIFSGKANLQNGVIHE